MRAQTSAEEGRYQQKTEAAAGNPWQSPPRAPSARVDALKWRERQVLSPGFLGTTRSRPSISDFTALFGDLGPGTSKAQRFTCVARAEKQAPRPLSVRVGNAESRAHAQPFQEHLPLSRTPRQIVQTVPFGRHKKRGLRPLYVKQSKTAQT